jgi:hypothetical protein
VPRGLGGNSGRQSVSCKPVKADVFAPAEQKNLAKLQVTESYNTDNFF